MPGATQDVKLRDRAVRIGTAGWVIPRRFGEHFPQQGSVLARYAGVFNAVEINSSFYRPHKPATYARWADSVPDDFRFAVKLPKMITHERRLVDALELLDSFLEQVRCLGQKLGPMLIQLPPSLAFHLPVAAAFLQAFRSRHDGALACEPRHPSWFDEAADSLLRQTRIARIAADPASVRAAALPSGDRSLSYFRLHGSPRMYFSDYASGFIETLAVQVTADSAADRWCIFDNTASGAATGNALQMMHAHWCR
jgi:uncharacterized protein YecE (DUF72 family)